MHFKYFLKTNRLLTSLSFLIQLFDKYVKQVVETENSRLKKNVKWAYITYSWWCDFWWQKWNIHMLDTCNSS